MSNDQNERFMRRNLLIVMVALMAVMTMQAQNSAVRKQPAYQRTIGGIDNLMQLDVDLNKRCGGQSVRLVR